MKIRDRIKELRRVRASELQPNPKNWRTHPKRQKDALKGALAEIGYADALLARETPEGGLVLIDGHLRAETTPNALVPVLVLDVDEAEAEKILATLDPLAAMAQSDAGKLEELHRSIAFESRAVQEMLADLAKLPRAVDVGPPARTEGLTPQARRNEEIEPRYAIIIECESEEEQVKLLGQLEKKGLSCRALVV